MNDVLDLMLGNRASEKAERDARQEAAHRIQHAGHIARPIETRLSKAGHPWHRGGCTCPWLSKASPDALDVVWAQIAHLWASEAAA